MEIEFDPDKDAKNIRERNLSLAVGLIILEATYGEVEDCRHEYGERRFKAFAKIDGRWLCCTYTLRGDVRRIFSVHRVRQKEVRRWLKRNG